MAPASQPVAGVEGAMMDRPNTAMAALVNASLAMANRRDAIAHLVANRVPDPVIARLLCARTDVARRRVQS